MQVKGSSKHLILVSLFFTLRSKADLDLRSLCERASREHFASTTDDDGAREGLCNTRASKFTLPYLLFL